MLVHHGNLSCNQTTNWQLVISSDSCLHSWKQNIFKFLENEGKVFSKCGNVSQFLLAAWITSCAIYGSNRHCLLYLFTVSTVYGTIGNWWHQLFPLHMWISGNQSYCNLIICCPLIGSTRMFCDPSENKILFLCHFSWI